MGVGADGGSPEGGHSPDEQPHGERKEPRAELLGFRNRLIVAVLFAAAYIATFGPRTGFLPGVISGVLGGVVIFLLLKEVDARRKRRHR
ncbi:hypothetical protein [Candidatus Solirubrobacter pratensis]|uniref:hypothetical protein n=1 Tax=Candidatus Solirubrobacter pratensis TaxID=1298857 RepID=UPI00041FA819|nr:hypothetical protein [Candidatus Solirubrobacter pratensis]